MKGDKRETKKGKYEEILERIKGTRKIQKNEPKQMKRTKKKTDKQTRENG